MSSPDYLSHLGLRLDGRRPTDFRRLAGQLGPVCQVDGSAFLEQGNTRVLVVVNGPREGLVRGTAESAAQLHFEWNQSSGELGRRPLSVQSLRGRLSNAILPGPSVFNVERLQDLLLSLQSAFEHALLLHTMPNSDIFVHVTVFQADGGLLACVINAVTLALIDAGIPMTDYVLALALAYDPASKSFLLDTNALEEQNPHKLPHFTVAMLHRSSKILSLLMDPPSKLPVDAFSQAMQAVVKGSLVLHQLLDQLVQNGKSQNLPSSTMVIE